jgi:hypothetical protein
MEWIMANYQNIFAIIGAAYTLALLVVKITPTPKDNEALEKVSVVLKAIAKVFGLDLTQGINTKGLSSLPIIIFMCLVFAGCAGWQKLTVQEKARVTCEDAMSQYEALHKQSVSLTADVSVKNEDKMFIATKINPKLNKLKPLIVSYCEAAVRGTKPSDDDIIAAISGIVNLFWEIGR